MTIEATTPQSSAPGALPLLGQQNGITATVRDVTANPGPLGLLWRSA